MCGRVVGWNLSAGHRRGSPKTRYKTRPCRYQCEALSGADTLKMGTAGHSCPPEPPWGLTGAVALIQLVHRTHSVTFSERGCCHPRQDRQVKWGSCQRPQGGQPGTVGALRDPVGASGDILSVQVKSCCPGEQGLKTPAGWGCGGGQVREANRVRTLGTGEPNFHCQREIPPTFSRKPECLGKNLLT